MASRYSGNNFVMDETTKVNKFESKKYNIDFWKTLDMKTVVITWYA